MTLKFPSNGHASWLSREDLHTLIDRERARADRSGRVFSIVTLRWDAARGEEVRPALTRLLTGRLRFTDEVGWLGDAEVGVVLVDTGAEGARIVARSLLREYPRGLPALRCEVAHYPSMTVDRLLVRAIPRGKRVADVAGALVGLLISAPFVAVAILLMKITSPGPALFTQVRAGIGGAPFTIYKLRTMRAGADDAKPTLVARNEVDGAAFKIRDDPRITRVGQFLRRTSLDECPQFWNVLKGDMSLVGPRPLPCDEAEACATWQRRRLDVTPGLTGLWQVSGRNDVPFTEWMRMDLRYVRARSFLEDTRVIARTVPAVLSGRGAY